MLVSNIAAWVQLASIGLAIYAVVGLGMAFWPVAGMLIIFNLLLGMVHYAYVSYRSA